MAGLDQQVGQVTDITDSEGSVVGHAYGGDPMPYTLADGREDHEARISLAALMAVSGAVGEMLDALALALEPISRGSLVVEAELPLAAGAMRVAVKRLRPKTWFKLLLQAFRRGRAPEAWYRGQALLARDIPYVLHRRLALSQQGLEFIGLLGRKIQTLE